MTEPMKALASKSDNPVVNLIDNGLEKTANLSAVDPDSQYNPWNADELYQKQGDYSIYEDMMKDDQVSVAMNVKKDLIIGSGWHITCEDDDQAEMKNCLEIALAEDLETSFEDCLSQIITAYEIGFSVTEKQFKLRDDGMLTLKNLKTRNPVSWLFHQDKFGNVVRYEQQGTEFRDIDKNSLIHFVNNPRYGNPYGTSDLRAAYTAYFIKKQITRFYAIFLEKCASPIPIAKYDRNIGLDAEIQKIHDTIKKLQTSSAMTIPKDFDIEFLQTTGNGEAYTKGINMFNMFIGRALFVPDLLGFQGGETSGGSQALGREQMVVFFKHIMRRRRTLENMVNHHIVKPLILWNYGEVENYPKFKLNPIEESQAVENAKLWLEAVRGRVFEASAEDINHFKRICEFPETTEEEIEIEVDPIEEKAAETSEQPDMKTKKEPLIKPEEALNGAQVTSLVDVIERVALGTLPKDSAKAIIEAAFNLDETMVSAIIDPIQPKSIQIEDGDVKPDEQIKDEPEKKTPNKDDFKKKIYDFPVGDYHKKTNFAAIEKQLDGNLDLFLAKSAPLVKAIFKKFADKLGKMKIDSATKLEKLDKVLMPKAEVLKLEKLLNESFKNSFKSSMEMASTEIEKNNFKILPAEEFLTALEEENYNFIGDWTYQVTKKTRAEIIAAVKDGKPISSVVNIMLEDGTKAAGVALERYARTKFTEVMNKGRMAFFESTGVIAAYQYSAVLDDRTTPICEQLHGKIFKVGEEPVPPLHFSCRSTLVPITKYEDWKADTKVGKQNIQDFIEDNKGDGFATQ